MHMDGGDDDGDNDADVAPSIISKDVWQKTLLFAHYQASKRGADAVGLWNGEGKRIGE